MSKPPRKKIRSLIRGELKITGNTEFPATNDWINQCYHKPKRLDLILSALNEVLEMPGVEALTFDGMHSEIEYLNSGDIYSPTLIYKRGSGNFTIGCIGTLIERNPKLTTF